MTCRPSSTASRDRERARAQERRGSIKLGSPGSGKSQALASLTDLSLEQQRFALFLIGAVGDVAQEMEISESRVRSLLYRLVHDGLLQQQRAAGARSELARTLGPSLADVDPVPYATVEQARRLAALRTSLLREGAFPTAAIAEARGMTANNARQWISRNRRAGRLFTVTHDGETLVPAFLLNDNLEPRPEPREAIKALRDAGEDGWALWAWFARPSSWLGGRVPAEVLASAPELVAESARQRAAATA